ncbi:MAG: serine/threonine-protein kinase [Myxococcales bacterium]|nr:serine/threonine protein kinase [Myxococcota bacterium]MDW8282416.1 serine/threonine-protein kinase [Myxococcales bacterium]
MTLLHPSSGTAGFPRPFGKYTLISHLAVGGMADVFLAQHRGPAGFEKECVIKRILPHLAQDEAFVHMFLDEARLSARLSHPNIVQIFDLGQQDGDYFLAMEFVDGVNLEQVLEEVQRRGEQALPWPVAVRIVSDVAAGLDHAHNSRDPAGRPLGLVHRDVSPSNIMVSWGGVAKILDFGIAKANLARKSTTEVGTIKGKVPYMSPEQLQGLPLDGRSDVFSLGVILYEMTCGSRPFRGETTPQLTVQILNEQPEPPERRMPSYPMRLQQIVLRALAKRPQDRWQTARDFQLALESLLASEHVSCTEYDVEALLRRLYPEGRRSLAGQRAVSGTEQTEIDHATAGRVARPLEPVRAAAPADRDADPAANAARLSAPPPTREVTGIHQGPQGRISDLGLRLDEIEQEERKRRGGGGGMMVVLVLLVMGTAAGLFLLRDYMLGRKEPVQAAADLAPVPSAPDAARPPDLAPPPALAPPPDLAPAERSADKRERPPREVRPVPKRPREREPAREQEPARKLPSLPRIDDVD